VEQVNAAVLGTTSRRIFGTITCSMNNQQHPPRQTTPSPAASATFSPVPSLFFVIFITNNAKNTKKAY
jgi:hypothetical protein